MDNSLVECHQEVFLLDDNRVGIQVSFNITCIHISFYIYCICT